MQRITLLLALTTLGCEVPDGPTYPSTPNIVDTYGEDDYTTMTSCELAVSCLLAYCHVVEARGDTSYEFGCLDVCTSATGAADRYVEVVRVWGCETGGIEHHEIVCPTYYRECGLPDVVGE